ncbi:hypothetical protein Patl1_15038 [Pistacia atlantica]|uniref:Uncharacterized protein n=1 Tax=Pistacia atlantica TaxID=434234 RepID=A0ACC1B8A3_9ROSI|nr:hypothetical protein Patl1_15038 [Pistacia atlantica]
MEKPKEINKERAKFAVSLTRKEIEEDLMESVGHRTPRKPKKRPRKLQNQINVMDQTELSIERVHEEAIGFCEKVRSKLSNSDYRMCFLKHFHDYSNRKIDIRQMGSLVFHTISQYPDLIHMFLDLLENCDNLGGCYAYQETEKTVMETQKEDKIKKRKMMDKPVQEIDLSYGQLVTPSYRFFPEEKRSEKADQVLNNQMVCVRPGNESFRHGHKNKYQRVLFECEDDQYEVDMLLNSLQSTKENIEKLLNNVKEDKLNLESSVKILDHLSILNVRCIERVYNKQGQSDQILEKLQNEPLVALPIILNRLVQKVDEVFGLKSKRNKIWAQVYAENYHKSLDITEHL